MGEDMETRRALEVCLSRVRMSRGASEELLTALNMQTPAPAGDVDAMRAALMNVYSHASGVSQFPRKSLLVRLELVRDAASEALS